MNKDEMLRAATAVAADLVKGQAYLSDESYSKLRADFGNNDACVREITKRLLKAAKDCIEEGEE
jgi:hypothetical protein